MSRCEHMKRLAEWPYTKRCEDEAKYQEDNGDRHCGAHATTNAQDIPKEEAK